MKPTHSTRREFLRLTAGTGLALAGTACDQKTRKAFLGPLGDAIDKVSLAGFRSPEGDQVDLITHVLSRLTWGIAPGDYERVAAMGKTPEEAVQRFIDLHLGERHADETKEAKEQIEFLGALLDPIGELYDYHPRQLNYELTRASLLRAVHSPNQLYEVMVGFWSDHFNIDSSKADCRWLKAWDDREVIRKHALGKFSDLVAASAKSPAMLFYLDGRENRRRKPEEKPNENYARELLELHTLGVKGGYTQMDVLEAARCLTGWTVVGRDSKTWGIGRVLFKKSDHDDGAKVVLGQKIPEGGGEKDFDLLLEIVTQHPSTAKFIATKLCRRFIQDEPPDSAVEAVAAAFTKSNGDIRETLKALFATEDFLVARRTKFKRPFHFLVSTLRATGLPHECGRELQRTLRRMGQMPFDYPTPEGYADKADDWMSTLLARWDFSLRLAREQLGVPTWKQETLVKAAGEADGLARHLLGRKPSIDETAALAATPERDRLALLLASPEFQLY